MPPKALRARRSHADPKPSPRCQRITRSATEASPALLHDSIAFGIASILLGPFASTAAHAQVSDIPSCGVQLRIQIPSQVVRSADSGEHLDHAIVAELMNTGRNTVTLVMPGDGSDFGRHAPMRSA